MQTALMRVALPCVAIALLACAEEPVEPPRYPFTFHAHADGRGLAGVQISVNDAPVGVTNEQGILQVDLTGPEGAPVRISAACPEGHRDADGPKMQNLRRINSLDPAAAARGIEVTFGCPPEHRNAVVVVRTHDQADLPVLLDGREVARTDASGAAHLAVAMLPGTTFQVLVDTRHNERLRPRSPTVSYTVPDHDEVFVFDRRFEEEKKPRARRPRSPARPRSTASRLPVRIQSHGR